jgi:hypothetical protein
MPSGRAREDTRTADQHKTEVPYWAREIDQYTWRRAIMELNEPLRGAVAAIVWWDVFSVRMFNDRWPALDGLIGSCDGISDQDLIAGLVAAGYSQHRAEGRVFPRQNRGAKGRPKPRPLVLSK